MEKADIPRYELTGPDCAQSRQEIGAVTTEIQFDQCSTKYYSTR